MPERVHKRFDDVSKSRDKVRVNGEANTVRGLKRKRDHQKIKRHPAVELQEKRNSVSEKRNAIQKARDALPIALHKQDIKNSLSNDRNTLILSGETGSGKSTQVPQYLVDEPWCTGCIAVTQPRRVAAISLAKRVADEMGTTLGSSSPASKVGYSVRFDTSVAPAMRIKFLTEGMLLQEMLRDPCLNQYSAVIVDEVHERSVNVDLILGFLKRLVTGKTKGRNASSGPLKAVVMSATADVEALQEFFANSSEASGALSHGGNGERNDGPVGRSEKVERRKSNNSPRLDGPSRQDDETPSFVHVEGRQHHIDNFFAPEPTQDFAEAALQTVLKIHHKEPLKPPADILVFLTGQDTVEAVESSLNELAQALEPDVPKLQILPIFAALPRSAQQAVFTPAPPNTRKVILATNIAETSVTIPGVRYVVDCGLAKEKEYRSQLGLDSLLVKPISKSSAEQRRGRAGREANGQCYRLYTESEYRKLPLSTKPEILRCDLATALLNMKARGVDDVLSFPLLDRPNVESLRRALLQLLRLGALEDSGKISKQGIQMARLPLAPPLGRVLIAASRESQDHILDAIDIIAGLTVENIFPVITTDEEKEEASIARRELINREGDHMTLLCTIKWYAAEKSDRKRWANDHFVSHRALQNVMNVRKQLRAQCIQQKMLPKDLDVNDAVSSSFQSLAKDEEHTQSLLKCFMHGFASNVARIVPDGSYRTIEGNQTVTIHPSSVLFGRKVEAILFNELVFTTKTYARGVSAVQLDWYGQIVAPA